MRQPGTVPAGAPGAGRTAGVAVHIHTGRPAGQPASPAQVGGRRPVRAGAAVQLPGLHPSSRFVHQRERTRTAHRRFCPVRRPARLAVLFYSDAFRRRPLAALRCSLTNNVSLGSVSLPICSEGIYKSSLFKTAGVLVYVANCPNSETYHCLPQRTLAACSFTAT